MTLKVSEEKFNRIRSKLLSLKNQCKQQYDEWLASKQCNHDACNMVNEIGDFIEEIITNDIDSINPRFSSTKIDICNTDNIIDLSNKVKNTGDTQ